MFEEKDLVRESEHEDGKSKVKGIVEDDEQDDAKLDVCLKERNKETWVFKED